MNNYLENIEDKEAFKDQIKQTLDAIAFDRIDDIKKEMANEFLTSEED